MLYIFTETIIIKIISKSIKIEKFKYGKHSQTVEKPSSDQDKQLNKLMDHIWKSKNGFKKYQ